MKTYWFYMGLLLFVVSCQNEKQKINMLGNHSEIEKNEMNSNNFINDNFDTILLYQKDTNIGDTTLSREDTIPIIPYEEDDFWTNEEWIEFLKEGVRLSKLNNRSLDSAIIDWSDSREPYFITADTIIKWWYMFPE